MIIVRKPEQNSAPVIRAATKEELSDYKKHKLTKKVINEIKNKLITTKHEFK